MLVEVIKDKNLVRLNTLKPGSVFEYDNLYYIKSTYDTIGGILHGCVELTSGDHNLFREDTLVRPVKNAKVVIG